jgi:hypothetical protein
MTISCWILVRMGNVSDRSCRGNKNSHSISVIFFRRFAVYTWKNYITARVSTGDSIIRCVRCACRITKARRIQTTHWRLCNTFCFSTATVVMRTRFRVTLYVHCLPCLLYIFCEDLKVTERTVQQEVAREVKDRQSVRDFTLPLWDENCPLLGYYAAISGNFLQTFRGKLSVPSSWPLKTVS